MDWHSYHAAKKLVPAERSKAGKEARAVQSFHAFLKLVPESNPVALKEVMATQPYHAASKSVPLDRSKAGNVVNALQPHHASVKLISSVTVVENVVPDGNSNILLQPYHVLSKFVPLDRSRVGKDVKLVLPSHALLKSMSSSAWVLNVQAPNDVIAVLRRHAESKSVPLDRFKAGKAVRAVQLRHAPVKSMSSSAAVLNVRVGKEANEVH